MAFELLDKYRETIWNDQACGVCHRGPWNPYPPKGPTSDRLCPEYEKFRTITHTAQGRIQAARWLLEGKYEPTDEFVKVVYDCLLCGACSTVGCVVDKDHVPMFRDLRADLVRMGKGPTEPFRKTASGIAKEGNRFGRPRAQRSDWASGIILKPRADILYFAGCVASYRTPELAKATGRILNKAGLPFNVLSARELCCGNPLLSSGQYDAFKSVAETNVASIREARAKVVVTGCGCCYNVLKFEYPRIVGELGFEVVHISEMLPKLIDTGRISPTTPVGEKLTYQDPCHLARLGAKIIKEPRQLLASLPGTELVEMEGNGKDTQCCGRFPVELPELSLLTGVNRVKDAQAAGATTIVTGCSFCHWNLNRAARSLGTDTKVLDITQLMAQALGL